MIHIDALTKRYGPLTVVDDFCLDIEAGESVALWGPNGAGKTTVVRCILGLLSYEGSIVVDGLDARRQGKAARRRMGYVPQELSFYDDLSVVETLDFSAALRKLPTARVDEVIEVVDLVDHREKLVRELSGGLKQRLGLASALLPDPPVLLLDEPTSNLDAAARESAVQLLHDLRDGGRLMVVTSHHLEEVGMLVDRVIAMDEGSITVECPPNELAERLGLRAWLHVVLEDTPIAVAVDALCKEGFDARANSYGVLVEVSAQGKGKALEALRYAGIGIADLEVWR
jgi:ABC-type multidrug transport system ATPase subunit